MSEFKEEKVLEMKVLTHKKMLSLAATTFLRTNLVVTHFLAGNTLHY